jgi:hypothetical protein
VCLRGVSEVNSVLFARQPDPRLSPFVVWVPKVRGKQSHIAFATRSIPDARASHYWDNRGRLMEAYQELLHLPEDGWDLFLLYGPEARWEGPLPPRPRFWMHQLGTEEKPRVNGEYLDAQRFARETLATLNRAPEP